MTDEALLQQLHLETQRQVQALLLLDKMVRVEAAVPPMGGWAASPDLLVLCVQAVRDLRPRVALECGSGLSTLYLALAIEQSDLPTRLVSLEHQADFVERTRALLRRHGVEHRVDVRHAPLVPSGLPGHDTPWYDAAALADLHDVGLLLVDGPPSTVGHLPRYPALPLLLDRLSEDCLVLVDDLDRPSDQEVAQRWAAELPLTLEVDTSLRKHVGLLRRA